MAATDRGETVNVFEISGRVIEVGRNEHDENEVVVRTGNQSIAICGLSDELTKRAAQCLYTDVTIELNRVTP